MAFSDIFDYFGAVSVKQTEGDITVSGFDTHKLLADIFAVWKNSKLAPAMFTDIRRYRLTFSAFFAPDVQYMLSQILEYKQRKSSRYRLRQAYDLLLSQTWLHSTVTEHADILDFTALKTLSRTPRDHQMETFKVYNEKVPRMNLNGFLLSTPPGCLTGDTEICFNRGGREFTLSLTKAYKYFQQLGSDRRNWDLSTPTYVRSYTGSRIQLHLIDSIVYSGIQYVYRVRLADGKFIDCTYQHPIMTSEGFIQAHDSIGRLVMCDQKLPKYHEVCVCVSANHPFAVKKNRNRDGISYEIIYHRALYEAKLNAMTFGDYVDALEDEIRIAKMVFVDPTIYAVHHRDHNHYNNSIDNLELMTHEDHQKHHAINDDLYKNFNQGIPNYVKAVSFDYLGSQPTYDIICQDPHRNFVANGIVVHNSGKTFMSIALGQMLHADLQIFIVPKATVDTVWFEEIREELGPGAKIWASTHDEILTPDYDYYIFHYETIPKAIALVKQIKNRHIPFLAIDESHNFNEIKSDRTALLVELAQSLQCHNTIFATGTPIKAVGHEAIPLLRVVDPLFTPEAERRFKLIFGLSAKRANDILRNRLGLISHKIPETYMTIPPPVDITKQVQVPNNQRFTIPAVRDEMQRFMLQRYTQYKSNMRQYTDIYARGIDLYERSLMNSQDRAQLRIYKDYVKIIIAGYDPIAHKEIAKFIKEFETTKIIPILPQPLRGQFKDALSIVKYVKMRVLGEALAIYQKRRAECAGELARYGNLEEIITNADKKTIIFSSYIHALDATYAYLDEKGFNALRIYGDTTKDVAAIVAQFKKDPSTNPLIATLQSLSASQTLTVANTIIFLNAPFRDYIFNQAYHRVFRIGQDVQTYNYTFVLDTKSIPNVSTSSKDILEWSRTQVDAIFGTPDAAEVEGIVRRLHLNSNLQGMDILLGVIKGMFGLK